MTIIIGYSLVLLSTVITELGIAYLFRYRSTFQLQHITIMNLVTNPLANALFWGNAYAGFLPNTLAILYIEAGVILVEWKWLNTEFKHDLQDLFKLSLAMNVGSYLISLILF